MRIVKDGNMWCVMHGKNIQEGRCGFGKYRIVAFWNYLLDCLNVKRDDLEIK